MLLFLRFLFFLGCLSSVVVDVTQTVDLWAKYCTPFILFNMDFIITSALF